MASKPNLFAQDSVEYTLTMILANVGNKLFFGVGYFCNIRLMFHFICFTES